MIVARLPGGNDCMNAVSFWYGVSTLQGFAASLTTLNEPSILSFASRHGVSDGALYHKGPLADVLRQYPPGPAATVSCCVARYVALHSLTTNFCVAGLASSMG